MKTPKQNKNTKIYSITGFRDTLASPVFYPVLVVSLVLGLASIFGFVQNPLKLKAVVNVIHQKVVDTKLVNETPKNDFYVVAKPIEFDRSSYEKPKKVHDIFSSLDGLQSPEKIAINEGFERIAFNYDVTSERFWSDLDSRQFESASEEMKRKDREAATFGAPLEMDDYDSLPSDFNINDDSIYALNKSNLK